MFLTIGLMAWGSLPAVSGAQAPLYLVDTETTVREVSFRFVDEQTFEAGRLKNQIATKAPGFFARLKKRFSWLPFVPAAERYDFDPVVLQRDVVRLRRFYEQNGFLDPQIDYPASQLDTTSNTIHVIFTVRAGPPVIIQNVDFYGPDSTQYAVQQFEGDVRTDWMDFRDQTTFRIGERYTEFNRTRIEDEVRRWLQNQGFAFARVNSQAVIDSSDYAADIRFFVAPGPRARFAEIDVEGNDSVSRRIVERELPFAIGDYFSYEQMLDGQRQLFGLNLFRVALADLPSQPVDSTVRVRYRVREASLRYLSAQSGYGTAAGLTSEGQWTHRNFLGAARNLTVGLVAETGFLSNPRLFSNTAAQIIPNRRFRASVSLRQPYFFTTNLSASIEPFLEYRRDVSKLEPSQEFLGINARDFGLNSTLVYEILPFRTLSFRHSFSRSFQFTQPLPDDTQFDTTDPLPLEGDLFNESVFSANAILGNVDDFFNPRSGFQIRPSFEIAGAVLGSGVEYGRVSNEFSGYIPLNDDIEVATRLSTGRLWPLGRSREILSDPADRLFDVYENRFDNVRFYAGGSNDVRGWRNQLVGDKRARPLILREETPEGIRPDTTGYVFEPVGGNTKLAANVELRLPFPGLSSAWRTAVFLDAGQVREGSFLPTKFRFGTGAGIRYRTPVGYLRLDLAYKLNPGPNDLRDPQAVYEYREGLRPSLPSPSFWQRFRIHIGIGQSF
jgi:outer membrane protein insertion porin family